VGGRSRRIEERVGGPHLENIGEATMRVLEQVSGLQVDLERVITVEQVDVKQGHT
jgi:hypothetical protein